jgi:DNA topoisomerase-2
MLEKTKPLIEKTNEEDYTSITFVPDLEKFKMKELDDDIISLFQKRVYDMAGVTPKSVSVYYNNKKLNVKNFESYIKMFLESSIEEDEQFPPIVFESPNDRWEIGFSLSESQFQQVSFVNSINTTKGGTHVTYVCDKIITKILEILQKKNKDLTIRPQHVRQHIWIFVNSLIENPAFNSQTKETLTTKKEEFGSSFDFSDYFIKSVLKSGITERCLRYAKTREEEKCLRKINGKNRKVKRLLGIDKLDDANWAGTKNSDKCTLILTEGDSAKALAMSGIEVVGRDSYGCFPLRGKMLNVRDLPMNKIMKNQEVQNIMKILGIRIGENYVDIKNLRYGHIMIMTDQDVDGSHIKGLIINFIHTFWPSLIKLNGFMTEFITPIIKATKKNEVLSFYTLPEYKEWIEKNNINLKLWKIKYYKGLGTSTSKEAQEYFSNLEKHKIDFEYENDQDDDCINMAFNKKKAEDRKNWLMNYNPNDNQNINLDVDTLSYKDFINKELILYSLYDNQRSIPSICDGLKPSERKILYGCFLRNLKEEIKVNQLIGYISEHTAYHHGEQSLGTTIVAMSQNFVGTNNINLLLPIGQFGSRNQGGKDSASPRYIHTTLNKVTRHLFNSNDLPLMNYQVEEGLKIEPTYYLPIIPLILVNGSDGIGTGWSTNVPCFNPRDIVKNIKNKLNGENFEIFHPWYKGYQGTILPDEKKPGSYLVTGKYKWSDEDPNILYITEIPIKKWTKDYYVFLQELMGVEIEKNQSEKKDKKKKKNKDEDEEKGKEKKKKPVILEDIKQNHTNNRINFEIKFLPEFASKFRENENLLLKTFNLQTQLSIKNMVLFNPQGQIHRYESVENIFNEFYVIRLELYKKRKEYMISILKRDVAILNNKVRFITEIINEELIIRKKKRAVLVNELYERNYTPMSKLEKIRVKTKEEIETEDLINQNKVNEEEENIAEEENSNKNENKLKIPAKEYDYLLSMNLWSLTFEKVEELNNQKKKKQNELDSLNNCPEKQLWINDLDNFLIALDEYEKEEEEDRLTADKLKKNKGKNNNKEGKKRRKKNNKKNKDANNSDDENKENKQLNIEEVFKAPLTLEQRLKQKIKNGETIINPNFNYNQKNKRKKMEDDDDDLIGMIENIKSKKI